MITSRGFGVDVMPTVYQAAPENLAINPNRMTQGMLEAFEVNDKLNRLRAFQLQQEELNANRAARINAERAKLGFASLSDDANASLVAPKTNLTALQLASDTKAQPDKAALELAGIKLASMQTGGKIEQQPYLNNAGLTTAMAAPEMAGKEVDFNRLTFGDKIDNFDLYKSLSMGKDAAQIEKTLADAAQARASALNIADAARRADEATAAKLSIAEKNNATREAIAAAANKRLSDYKREEEELTKQLIQFAKPSITTPEMGKNPVSVDEITGAGFVLDPKTGQFVQKNKWTSDKTLSSGAAALIKQRDAIQNRLLAIEAERKKVVEETQKALAAGDEVVQTGSGVPQFKTPDEVKAALKSGQIKSVEDAKKILVQQFGFTP